MKVVTTTWMTRAALTIALAVGGVSWAGEEGAGDVMRHVRYGFTLRNPRAEVVREARLWFYAPAARTGSQRAGALTVSCPHRVAADTNENRFVSVVFSNVPPFAVKVVQVDAWVELGATGVDGGGAAPASGAGAFLCAEPLVPFDSEAFARRAPRFGDERTPATVRRIFDWVRGHVKDAGYIRHDRGALYALETGSGDCTESALLFTALCRRQGIPARTLGGYVVERDRVLVPNTFHNWAEWLEDGRWRLADVQEGVFDGAETRYVATRIYGPPREPMREYARFRYEPKWLDVRMN